MNIKEGQIDYISKRRGFKFFVILTRVSFYTVRGGEIDAVAAFINQNHKPWGLT